MSLELFQKTLEFTKRAECEVLRMGLPLIMMLSGGECTDNPGIVDMVEMVIHRGWLAVLLTHGLWLEDPVLREHLIREKGIWRDLVFIQVTNDDRYYPRKPLQIEHNKITYTDRLQVLSTLGRAASPEFDPKGLTLRAAPSSFNLRSLTHHHRSVATAIQVLRLRGIIGKSGFCTPSVCHDGTVVAGESRFCYPIGTVDSTNEELTQAILTMGSCNRCKQEEFLGPAHKRSIGLM